MRAKDKTRYEVGKVKGTPYTIVYDQFKNQQGCDDSIANQRAWFLWVGNEYEGNFRTKREALKRLDEICDEIYIPDTSAHFMTQGKSVLKKLRRLL